MLRVTLEATTWDAGHLVLERLGTLEIVEDGRGTPTHGNYHWQQKDAQGRVSTEGQYRDYPRALGAWVLVHAVLHEMPAARPTSEPLAVTQAVEAAKRLLDREEA